MTLGLSTFLGPSGPEDFFFGKDIKSFLRPLPGWVGQRAKPFGISRGSAPWAGNFFARAKKVTKKHAKG
jgi:hypothetical protein